MMPELVKAGVTELVIVSAPPADPAGATTWITDLAARWRPPARP